MPTEIPANAALLIIDVQVGFAEPSWGVRNNPQAEEQMARLLAAWRAAGRPVVHVQHDSQLPTSPLRPGQPGNAIQPLVAPRDGERTYRKVVNSAFIGTTLEPDLRAQEIDTVVVVGLTTNHCVSTTVRMAANLGFATYVVSDATAAFDRPGLDGTLRPAAEVHASALSDLHEEFATVLTADEVLAGARSAIAV